MPSIRKKVRKVSIFLSIIFFYLAAASFGIALVFFRSGITPAVYLFYVFSIVTGIVASVGCVICVYLAVIWTKTKVWKETYFFVVFVPISSVSMYIVCNFILWIDVPADLLIILSIVVGTFLSCAFAGYPEKKIWVRLRRLGLTQGITLVTLIFLGLLPIIRFLPQSTVFILESTGRVVGQDLVFESGNDIGIVQGQIAKSVFAAEVSIPSNTTFVVTQAVNVTNQSFESLDLKIYIEDLSGNLSKVRELKIFFTLGNGTEICPLKVNNSNVEYKEASLEINSHATIAMGVIALAQNVTSTDVTVMSMLLRCDKHDLSINISVVDS